MYLDSQSYMYYVTGIETTFKSHLNSANEMISVT